MLTSFRTYIFSAGLELMLELLQSTSLKQKQDGSGALYKLATKATSLSPVDAAPPSPNPQVISLINYWLTCLLLHHL